MAVPSCASRGRSFIRKRSVDCESLAGTSVSESLPKGATEEIRVENGAGGGWTDTVMFRSQNQISSWADESGYSINWLLLSDCSRWAEEERPVVLEQSSVVLVLPGTWALVQGDRTGHRCAAFLQFPLGKANFLFMNIERCCSMVKRRWHSENHCLIIHVIKSIHTEQLNKNVMWDFLKCKLEL